MHVTGHKHACQDAKVYFTYFTTQNCNYSDYFTPLNYKFASTLNALVLLQQYLNTVCIPKHVRQNNTVHVRY